MKRDPLWIALYYFMPRQCSPNTLRAWDFADGFTRAPGHRSNPDAKSGGNNAFSERDRFCLDQQNIVIGVSPISLYA